MLRDDDSTIPGPSLPNELTGIATRASLLLFNAPMRLYGNSLSFLLSRFLLGF
jgi:hypothetical protein